MRLKKPRTLPRDPRGLPNTLVIHSDLDTFSMIPSDLSQIESVAEIENVSIRGPKHLWKDEFDFSVFQDFTDLKHLEIINATVEFIDLSPLSTCTKLESLYIKGCRGVKRLTLFSNSSLHTLAITKCRSLWGWDLSQLTDCTSLEWVYLANNALGGTIDLKWLNAFEELPYIDLQMNCISGLNLGWLLDKCGFEEIQEKIFVSDIDGGLVVLERDDGKSTGYAWDSSGYLYSLSE